MHLEVTLKPGAWIDPGKFVKQIADAGYAARTDDIRLTLIGTVNKDADRLLLMVDDVKPDRLKFELVQAVSKNQKEASAWDEALRRASASAGKPLEVEGFWRPANVKKNKDALPTLSVIRVAEVKAAGPQN